MNKLLIIPLLFFIIIGQAQNPAQLLEKAYKKKSNRLLKSFFKEWQQEIQPVSPAELSTLNDTLKQTYLVFKEFYKPLRIDSLGGSEWGSDIYKDTKFLIVQNFIKIYFTNHKIYYTKQEVEDYAVKYIKENIKNDSIRNVLLKRIDGKLSKSVLENFSPYNDLENDRKLVDSIIDFRPQINVRGKQPLYLNKRYHDLLKAFLGNEHTSLGTGGILNPAHAKGESENRKRFLEKYIKIWYGHWGGYWQFITYPLAYSVTFDKEMKYARVDFRMVYEGGEAILKNENGNWQLISSKITWIE